MSVYSNITGNIADFSEFLEDYKQNVKSECTSA